jgi:hypothetical protein
MFRRLTQWMQRPRKSARTIYLDKKIRKMLRDGSNIKVASN